MTVDLTPPMMRPAVVSQDGRNALYDFARIALTHFQERAPDGQIPQRIEHRLVFIDGPPVAPGQPRITEHTTQYFTVPRAESIPTDVPKAWLQRSEVLHLLRQLWDSGDAPHIILSGPNGEVAAPTFDQVAPRLLSRLLDVVRNYIRDRMSFEFDAPAFENAYAAFRYSELINEAVYLVTVPLFGFYSEVESVQLAGNLAIEGFRGEEKSALWMGELGAGYATMLEWSMCDFALHIRHMKEVTDPHSQEEALRRTISRVLTALRLSDEGTLTAPAQFRRLISPYPSPGGQASNLDDWGSRGLHFHKYHLRADRVSNLQEFYSKLEMVERLPAYHQLELAIRRLNQSYARDNQDDQILDLAIALESSLLYDVEDELSHRLALRGAALLRKDIPPTETYRFLRTLYAVRSLIVHEGWTLRELATAPKYKRHFRDVPFGRFAAEARNYVRLVIRAFVNGVERGETVESVSRHLDDQIVESLAH